MMLVNKRGISDLIATTIMIVLTVSAVVIVATVLISFVKTNLDKSKTDCLTSIDKIEIVPEGSCYNNTAMSTLVRVKFGNINITKIYFILNTPAGTEITKQDLDNVIPGMVKAFTFPNINSSKAEIGIIINDKQCDISDSAELERC